MRPSPWLSEPGMRITRVWSALTCVPWSRIWSRTARPTSSCAVRGKPLTWANGYVRTCSSAFGRACSRSQGGDTGSNPVGTTRGRGASGITSPPLQGFKVQTRAPDDRESAGHARPARRADRRSSRIRPALGRMTSAFASASPTTGSSSASRVRRCPRTATGERPPAATTGRERRPKRNHRRRQRPQDCSRVGSLQRRWSSGRSSTASRPGYS